MVKKVNDVVILSRCIDIFSAYNLSLISAFRTLSSAEAPANYPYSNNRKNRKGAGDDGKREKAGASLLSFPFPSCPERSLFLSPQPPHNKKGESLQDQIAPQWVLKF